MKEWPTGQKDNACDSSVTLEGTAKNAAARAMKLLLFKPRTEKELRDRLREEAFSDEDIEAAVRYCSSFGYVNDARFAENYVTAGKEKKSHAVLRREMTEKGVSEEFIEAAFEKDPFDEGTLIYSLLCKKAGQPHPMDDRELRRVFAFLARKGFPSGEIWKAIRRFQSKAPEETYQDSVEE